MERSKKYFYYTDFKIFIIIILLVFTGSILLVILYFSFNITQEAGHAIFLKTLCLLEINAKELN